MRFSSAKILIPFKNKTLQVRFYVIQLAKSLQYVNPITMKITFVSTINAECTLQPNIVGPLQV
jgi:hypothetical protein